VDCHRALWLNTLDILKAKLLIARIPFNDLTRQLTLVEDDLRRAADRVIQSGWYILGAEGEAFEAEFARYCGVSHCVGVGNGTDALEIALRATGIGQGNQVATVANAGFYTSTALLAIGARPVFIDVNPANHLMDVDHLEQTLQKRKISAVVVTHLYGLLHEMDHLLNLSKRYNVPLIEDCAQAHGAVRAGKKSGSFGHVAAFSFYPTKNLGAIGDGGAITTNDPAVAAKLRSLRQYGWESKYRALNKGGQNSRLDEIQAAALRAKLPFLDDWNRRRRGIALEYSSRINNPRVTCPPARGEEYVAHLYVIACDNRDELRAHMSGASIATDIHYPVADHNQPAMTGYITEVEVPATEALISRIITLPCYPELTEGEVTRVIDAVNDWR